MHIEIGAKYTHFKGGQYVVLAIATHTETNEDLVVYQSRKDSKVWVRPAKMWNEIVDKEKNIRRFNRNSNGQI